LASIEPQISRLLSELDEKIEIKILVQDLNKKDSNKFMEIFSKQLERTVEVKPEVSAVPIPALSTTGAVN
jgi:hypothetical protein